MRLPSIIGAILSLSFVLFSGSTIVVLLSITIVNMFLGQSRFPIEYVLTGLSPWYGLLFWGIVVSIALATLSRIWFYLWSTIGRFDEGKKAFEEAFVSGKEGRLSRLTTPGEEVEEVCPEGYVDPPIYNNRLGLPR